MRTLNMEELSAVSGGTVGKTGNPVVLALAFAANGTNQGLNMASTGVIPRSTTS
jgi:hypothetical protein